MNSLWIVKHFYLLTETNIFCNWDARGVCCSELVLRGLHCDECSLNRQLEVIHKAFNELGCEEPPAGCDLPLDHSFENGNINDNQVSACR